MSVLRNVKQVALAAAAVVSLCGVANAANGTWTYNVAQDAFMKGSLPDALYGTTQASRFAQMGSTSASDTCWFGDWSAAQKADILAKIAAMVPGETYTLTFRIALDDTPGGAGDSDSTNPGSPTFTPTVAVFKADNTSWTEATVTTNNASTGDPWKWQGTTTALVNLPKTINSTNMTGFGGLRVSGWGAPSWATVTLDSTVANLLLSDPNVRGLRGWAPETYLNDGVFTKEKWSGNQPANLVLTIVPEPVSMATGAAIGGLALLRRRRA